MLAVDEGGAISVAQAGRLLGITQATVVQRWRLHRMIAWKAAGKAEAEVIDFLAFFGFDFRLAMKVRRIWPENTIGKLRENPYRMLAFSNWRVVDAAALALNLDRGDPRRLIAAVENVLYRRLEAKHTATALRQLRVGIVAALGPSQAHADQALTLARKAGAVVECPAGIQPLGAAVMERFIVERCHKIKRGPQQVALFSPHNLTALSAALARSKVTLTPEQQKALEMALSEPISLIVGGAGVGKTTLLALLHEVTESCGGAILQMALSGRAAKRLSEATRKPAYTIAHALRDDRLWEKCGQQPLVVIDEASMVDLATMYRVFRRIPQLARLLLVGDPYQLPPIGFGLVFHVLAQSENVPRTALTIVQRQQESTGIPALGSDIRRGKIPRLAEFTGTAPGVSFIEADTCEVPDALDCVLWELGLDQVQILSPLKHGHAGVVSLNTIYHDMLKNGRRHLEGWNFAEGEPVLYQVNDQKLGLCNGSLGTVLSIPDPKESRVLCRFDGATVELGPEHLPNLSLAYAISVHKSQGSQFNRVIVPILRSRLLDRTLVYTAITRAITQAVLVGDRQAFEDAIVAQPNAHLRQVGFSI